MKSFPLTNSLSVSVGIYRALLTAYPKKYREHYETQMVQVFRDSLRYEYRHHGTSGAIDLWLHTFIDLLITALVERISEGSQYMFSPKVILWGGVASVFAGLFWLMAGLAPSSGGFVLALILGLGGLAGLYSRQARQGGKLGLAGFALGIIGTVLVLAVLWWSSTIFSGPTYAIIHLRLQGQPVLAGRAVLMGSLALLTLGIGLALLGLASLRAKTLPRWRGLPLGLGLLNIIYSITIVLFAYGPLSQGQNIFDPWPPEWYAFIATEFVLLGLGWIGLGAMLAIEAEAKIAQPPPASA
jgi:hypothetical protein